MSKPGPNSHSGEKPQTFLLVEDDAYDALFVEIEFGRAELGCNLHVVGSGLAAREYLEGRGEYADRERHPLPDVILLDLRLPIMDGFEFLKWLRSEAPEAQRETPVIVMSGSRDASDLERAGAWGADAFLSKPVDWEEYRRQIRDLGRQWNTPLGNHGKQSTLPSDR